LKDRVQIEEERPRRNVSSITFSEDSFRPGKGTFQKYGIMAGDSILDLNSMESWESSLSLYSKGLLPLRHLILALKKKDSQKGGPRKERKLLDGPATSKNWEEKD